MRRAVLSKVVEDRQVAARQRQVGAVTLAFCVWPLSDDRNAHIRLDGSTTSINPPEVPKLVVVDRDVVGNGGLDPFENQGAGRNVALPSLSPDGPPTGLDADVVGRLASDQDHIDVVADRQDSILVLEKHG